MKPSPRKTIFATAFSSLALAVAAAETDPAPDGPTAFDAVRPILEQNCLRCHGPEKPKSNFRLDNRAAALRGGTQNPDDLVPGHSERSKLIAYVAGTNQDIQMPPPGRGKPLAAWQVAVLRAWIDQGAAWDTNRASAFTAGIEPVASWTGVHGDRNKFHELEGVRAGGGGGAGNFSMTEQLSPDTRWSIEGHALAPQSDFKLRLALDNGQVGFVHGGFERWRKYYDDTGGYFPGFTPSSYSLGRDLHLDIGRIWVDFGVTLPDRPQLVLGYEYRFRQGDRSTLTWGTAVQGATARNIYPDAEHLDERTHIIKMDLTREWDDWYLENRARIEVYHLGKSRDDAALYTTGPTPDVIQRTDQAIRSSLGTDTFRIEKQIKEWWRASAGALLIRYDGTSLLDQSARDGSGAPAFGNYWRTEGITLERHSYVGSLASLFTPVQSLSISAAVQGEWTHQDGFGNVDLDFGNPAVPGLFFPFAGTVTANQNRREFSENLAARFSGLPHTVLFAEGRLRQQSVGQFDRADNATDDAVEQRTDALNRFYDARAGFTTSPWTAVEWGGHVRRRQSVTSYDHLVDNTPNSPVNGDGYPAFIRHREVTLDEVEGRFVWRPAWWLNTRLTYDWDRTGFSSVTDPVSGSISPGGPVFDGRTETHNVGLTLTLTPGRRLYFSGTFTYTRSETTTTPAAAPEVAPYRGNVFTLGSSTAWVLNEKTDLDVTYRFSRSAYGQNNTAGIPLGLDFTRHELLAGIKRQWTKNLSGRVDYRFSRYAEPSSGGVNDFTAHGIFATFVYR